MDVEKVYMVCECSVICKFCLIQLRFFIPCLFFLLQCFLRMIQQRRWSPVFISCFVPFNIFTIVPLYLMQSVIKMRSYYYMQKIYKKTATQTFSFVFLRTRVVCVCVIVNKYIYSLCGFA